MVAFWFLKRRRMVDVGANFADQSSGKWARVFSWQIASGRLYAQGKGIQYLLPKDAGENSRLNFQHYLMHLSTGSHVFAPLPPDLRAILDVGTGTGIWAIELANQYPGAQVIGVDITMAASQAHVEATQQQQKGAKFELPPNCRFEIANVITSLPYEDMSFDYTHQRFLVAAVQAEAWPSVVRELVRVTRIGGWIELVETGGRFEHAGPKTLAFMDLGRRLSSQIGYSPELMENLDQILCTLGVPEVEKEIIPLNVGDWAGRAGSMLKKDLLAGYTTMGPLYSQHLQITEKQFARHLEEIAHEWEQYHSSFVLSAFYGRRVN